MVSVKIKKTPMISHRRLCLLRCPVRGIAFVHRFRVSGTLMRCAPYCGAPYGVSPAVHLRCIALLYVFSKNQLLFLTCPYHTLSPNTCIVKNDTTKKEAVHSCNSFLLCFHLRQIILQSLFGLLQTAHRKSRMQEYPDIQP